MGYVLATRSVLEVPIQSSTLRFVAGVAERQRASSQKARGTQRPSAAGHTCSFVRQVCAARQTAQKDHGLRAVQQAAAPDRGLNVGPALKRLARCRLRRLRSRHVKARGQVSGSGVRLMRLRGTFPRAIVAVRA